MFTGGAYGPAPLTATEATEPPPMPDLVALDCPDWLAPALRAALGEDFAAVMGSLRARAPVFLRVNAARATRDDALAALAGEGVLARPHSLANFALEVTDGARKIERTQAYLGGLVELQDASSQAVVEALPLADGMRVLDHCAGGGGKLLAMAARAKLTLWAHDIAPRRMADLPERAARAGIGVTLTEAPEATAPYDLVLVDAPCSGSGSWRRDPEGKWALTPERLEAVRTEQAAILDRAAAMVASGGALAYATCSLLHAENGAQVDAFLKRSPGWAREDERSFLPTSGGDGFYLGVMRRN
jgi:16S rRNA (cytosine967-C5)-methyltransferase